MSVAPDWIKFYAIVHWTLAYTTAYTAVQAVYSSTSCSHSLNGSKLQ